MKKLGGVIHIGIVVKDLTSALKIYQEKFHIKEWEIAEKNDFFSDKLVNNQIGIEFASAIYRGEELEIELIEPTTESIFKEWLDKHGPGVHHMKFKTDLSYHEMIDLSENKPYLEITWPDGRPIVAYADFLEHAGLIMEVNNQD